MPRCVVRSEQLHNTGWLGTSSRHFVSVCRVRNEHDLSSRPALVMLKLAWGFRDKTIAINPFTLVRRNKRSSEDRCEVGAQRYT